MSMALSFFIFPYDHFRLMGEIETTEDNLMYLSEPAHT